MLSERNQQNGFTLVELLVIVIILGLIMTYALPRYISYVELANSATVNQHFEAAVKFTRNEFQRTRADLATGTVSQAQADAQLTDAQLLVALRDSIGGENFDTGSPGGSSAFDGSANDALGTVGIESSGTIEDGDLVVNITRPQ